MTLTPGSHLSLPVATRSHTYLSAAKQAVTTKKQDVARGITTVGDDTSSSPGG